MPRLRLRPGLPRLRPAARLPPRRHDAPLPPLRARLAAASRCPSCASPRIRYLGGGTERVEREVRERFPRLRVGRLDRDVVERKGAADRVLDAFADGGSTCSSARASSPRASTSPRSPWSASCRPTSRSTCPTSAPPSGPTSSSRRRSAAPGAATGRGAAIIQTYQPEHPAIRAVAEGDADAFYDEELELRARFGSPPFGRLVKLTVALADRDAAEAEGEAMADGLRAAARERDLAVQVVGPAPAYVARRGDRWRFNVVLRGRGPGRPARPPPGPVERRRRPGVAAVAPERGARGICKGAPVFCNAIATGVRAAAATLAPCLDRVLRGLRSVLLAVAVAALVVLGRMTLDQLVGPRGWYVLLFAGVFVTARYVGMRPAVGVTLLVAASRIVRPATVARTAPWIRRCCSTSCSTSSQEPPRSRCSSSWSGRAGDCGSAT